MKRAVYAGSFDPVTNGHQWMIDRGSVLFDELIVAVGSNPEKQYSFDEPTRRRLLEEVCGSMANVRTDSFLNRYLIDYAQEQQCSHLLRGIRSELDFQYEKSMRHINEDMCGSIDTVFLIPPRTIAEISSSFVKGLIGPDGWPEVVRQYVPDCVFEEIVNRFGDD